MMLLGLLLSTIAIGAFFAAASGAEDNDGGLIACQNRLTGSEIKRDNSISAGVVYDATKAKSVADAKTTFTDPVTMNENADQDSDED